MTGNVSTNQLVKKRYLSFCLFSAHVEKGYGAKIEFFQNANIYENFSTQKGREDFSSGV
jgi:hypothetical protein